MGAQRDADSERDGRDQQDRGLIVVWFSRAAAAMFGVSVLALAAPASAQQFLYTPQPPKGSAYVRFVNTLDSPASLSADFLPVQKLGAATADRVAAYGAVEHVAGRHLTLDVTAGERHGHASLVAVPGSFVTVILAADGAASIAAIAIVDQTDFNQTKSHLSFYNTAGACPTASLKLSPANASVFTDVALDAAKSRSVNPVTATVVPDCSGKTGPAVSLQGLEPGGMYSIWVMQPNAPALVSFITRDTTLPYSP